MPLIIESGRVPSRWAEKIGSRSVVSIASRKKSSLGLNLALINNMPDAALEDTELQFFELLDEASESIPVVIKLYSLTGIPRTDRGQRHLNSFYCDFHDLWDHQFDGIIMTGTEPHQPNLRDEPYWRLMSEVFDWAGENTTTAVLSCLAAHASVLHADGVSRRRLPDKQFGVFESPKTCEHILTAGIAKTVRFPHSRWNEVCDHELTACGYTVLTRSALAGVDLFTKKKKRSLFVHFQGHPEYGAHTLFKEYRRDIKRFVRGERDSYPTQPFGYFDEGAAQLLSNFEQKVLHDRREEVLDSFPDAVGEQLRNSWHTTALIIYRNWIQHMAAERIRTPLFAVVADSARQPRGKLRVAP